MKRLLAGVALAFLSGPLGGQEAEPPVFRADVQLVLVDAVVLDDEGQPVAGLAAEDFELRDEGEPRQILSFEALDFESRPEPITSERRQVSTNVEPLPGRVVAVLWDDAHLSPLTGESAKRALSPWLEAQLREGQRVVLASTGGLWRVADGPRDQAGLLEAVDGLEGVRLDADQRGYVSDYEAVRISSGDPVVRDVVLQRFVDEGVGVCEGPPPPDFATQGSGPRTDWACRLFVEAQAGGVAREARDRSRATLRAIERLCDVLALARGRKSVILISQGFPQDLDDGDRLEAATRAAQRANAVVEYLDPAGLQVMPGYDASRGTLPSPRGALKAQAVLDAEQSGAEQVALDTGGRVLRKNALAEGLDQIAREARTHYLVGFAPPPGGDEGRFRRLSLSVDRPGLEVRARRGYMVDRARPKEPEEELRRALAAPFDLPGHPLRVAAWVQRPRPPDLNRVVLGIDVATPPDAGGGGTRPARFGLVVEVESAGRRWVERREIVFGSVAGDSGQTERHWHTTFVMLDLPAGVFRARAVVTGPGASRVGAVTHTLEVPEAGAWRLSTPLLWASPLAGSEESPPVPVLTTEREFAAAGALYGQFAVYGAAAQDGLEARLGGSWSLRPAADTTSLRSGSLDVATAADGRTTGRLRVPLEGLSAGPYELVLHVRDEAAGRELEDVQPFTLASAPGEAHSALGLSSSTPQDTAAGSARSLGQLAQQYRGAEREEAVAQVGLWTKDELEAATQVLVETVEAAVLARDATPGDVARGQQTLQAGAVLLCHAALRARPRGDQRWARAGLRSACRLTETSERIAPGWPEREFARRFYRVTGLALHAMSDLVAAHEMYSEGLRRGGRDAELLLGLGQVTETIVALRTYEPPRGARREPDLQYDLQFQMEGGVGEGGRIARTSLADVQALYTEAVELDPGLLEARLRLGRVLQLRGRHDEALVELDRVSKESRQKSARYMARLIEGRARVRLGDIQGAAAAFAAAVAEVPWAQSALVALGRALARLGEVARAQETFERALMSGIAAPTDPWLTYISGLDSVRGRAQIRPAFEGLQGTVR